MSATTWDHLSLALPKLRVPRVRLRRPQRPDLYLLVAWTVIVADVVQCVGNVVLGEWLRVAMTAGEAASMWLGTRCYRRSAHGHALLWTLVSVGLNAGNRT